MTKKPPRQAIHTAEAVFTAHLTQLSNDPRRRRFHRALMATLPILTPDEMDKIEPILTNAIGRDWLVRVTR